MKQEKNGASSGTGTTTAERHLGELGERQISEVFSVKWGFGKSHCRKHRQRRIPCCLKIRYAGTRLRTT